MFEIAGVRPEFVLLLLPPPKMLPIRLPMRLLMSEPDELAAPPDEPTVVGPPKPSIAFDTLVVVRPPMTTTWLPLTRQAVASRRATERLAPCAKTFELSSNSHVDCWIWAAPVWPPASIASLP